MRSVINKHKNNMKKIQFVLNVHHNFDFDIVEFDPAAVFGSGWKFGEEINGLPDNDEITVFQKAIEKASTLPKDDGRNLLFPTGIETGNKVITGDDRIKVLSAVNLSDPVFLWSLYKEDGQKTLHYLHDTYGVTWMESLRRILLNPAGNRCALFLNRVSDGSWYDYYYWLDFDRNVDDPAVSFAI